LSIAREQMRRGGKVLLLLSGKNSVAQSAVAEKYDIPCIVLPQMPSPSVKRPLSFWKFAKGYFSGKSQAKKILKAEKPDAVLGMGSFASLPVIVAAKKLRLPIFLHDGNARIGRANRYLSRWAKVLATAFPAVNSNKVRCKCVVSGMPVRPELKLESLSKVEAIKALNGKFDGLLEADYFTVLLFGGSQGARKLNNVFGEAMNRLAEKYGNVQLIHLSGSGEFDAMAKFHAEAKYPVLLLASLSEMHLAYNAADLVIARSGGSSVAEINAFGKYAVVVPFPFAAELHQDDNANYLKNLGAAEIIKNDALTADLAFETLKRLYLKKDLQTVGKNASRSDAWDGAENMLKLIDTTLEKNE
jgi:UDP-N-acetylglucosamine--N-acetylmuramyl-(pentapeptide) pyrophosphoryl-undecaprenol N-acetylglucosamine transferase